MGHDYIQIQTAADYFSFREELFTERPVTAAGVTKKGLDVGRISNLLNLPARITNKVKLEVSADAWVTLGLPATLLGPQYFDMIDAENFDQCLQVLVDCRLVNDLDKMAIRNSSKVVRIEIARDVIPTVSPRQPDYRQFRFFLRNAYRWSKITPLVNSFGSRRRVENFKIYGKTREMKAARHSRFKRENGIWVPEGLVRLEYRLTSAKKVKSVYGSKNLNDVLLHEQDVLSNLFKDAFVDIDPITLYQPKSGKPFEKRLEIARTNDFDPVRIQEIARTADRNKNLKLRKINQAIIATVADMQRTGNILKELLELQAIQSQN